MRQSLALKRIELLTRDDGERYEPVMRGMSVLTRVGMVHAYAAHALRMPLDDAEVRFLRDDERE